MIIVIILVTLLAFFMVNVLPGNIVNIVLGDQYTPAAAAEVTKELNLDQPIIVRYLIWLGQAVRLDFGFSLTSHVSVAQEMIQDALPTVELLVGALITAVVIGSAFAIAGTVTRGPWVDRVGTAIALFFTSMPNFVVGLLVALIFAVDLQLIPSTGWIDPAQGGWGQNLKAMIAPSIVLGFTIFPGVMRIFRAELRGQIESEEYVTLARMKGVSTWRIVWRHVARNSAFGLVTVVAASVGTLISGAVILENIFSIPGLGTMLFTGIQQHDSPVVVGVITIVAVVVVLSNLGADLLYGVLDPRVRDAIDR